MMDNGANRFLMAFTRRNDLLLFRIENDDITIVSAGYLNYLINF